MREGLKDVLLGPAQLYEALREKAGQPAGVRAHRQPRRGRPPFPVRQSSSRSTTGYAKVAKELRVFAITCTRNEGEVSPIQLAHGADIYSDLHRKENGTCVKYFIDLRQVLWSYVCARVRWTVAGKVEEPACPIRNCPVKNIRAGYSKVCLPMGEVDG